MRMLEETYNSFVNLYKIEIITIKSREYNEKDNK